MEETTKFNNMIQAFAADFELAQDAPRNLLQIIHLIENKNEEFLKDVELLSELAFSIRTNQIKICENKEE